MPRLAFLLIACCSAVTAQQIQTVASLHTARIEHAATLLSDGRVLVTGGNTYTPSNGWQTVGTAEIYDPALDQWSELPENPRAAHAAVRLRDGRVLVAGGDQVDASGAGLPDLATAEIFDPKTNAFTPINSMNQPGCCYALREPDGTVTVTGDAAIQRFDPTLGLWSVGADTQQTVLGYASAVGLADGRLFIRDQLTASWVYDWRTNLISSVLDPNNSCATGYSTNCDTEAETTTLLANGEVLVTGGVQTHDAIYLRDANLYVPATNQMTSTGRLVEGLGEHAAALLPSGDVLLIGGITEPYPPFGPVVTNHLELYQNGSFQLLPVGLATPRYGVTATRLLDGRVLIVGGADATGFPTALVEIFTPAPTATITTLSSSLNPSTYGRTETFTARVNAPALTANLGTVTFNDGTATLGTVNIANWKASLSTKWLRAGAHSITATYNGIVTLLPSTSAALTETVYKAKSYTSLASSVNPSKYGQSLTLTATVKPQYAGTPQGSVAFYDGTTALKTVTLSSGKASFTSSALHTGANYLKAVYSGSSNFLSSSSAVLTETVSP